MSSLLFHLLVSDLTLTGVHETIVPILFDPTILYSQMGIILRIQHNTNHVTL